MVPLTAPEPSRIQYWNVSLNTRLAHTISDLKWIPSIDEGRAGRSAKSLVLGAARLGATLDGTLRCLHPEVRTASVHDDIEVLWWLCVSESEAMAPTEFAHESGLTVPICTVEK